MLQGEVYDRQARVKGDDHEQVYQRKKRSSSGIGLRHKQLSILGSSWLDSDCTPSPSSSVPGVVIDSLEGHRCVFVTARLQARTRRATDPRPGEMKLLRR